MIDHESRLGRNYTSRQHTPETRAKLSAAAKQVTLTKKRQIIDVMNRRNRRASRMKMKP